MPETSLQSESGSERRKHPRVVAQFDVRLRQLEPTELARALGSIGDLDPELPAINLVRGRSGNWKMATTNLSAGGLSATGDLQVEGDAPLSKGADLLVEMDLKDGQEPLRAVGQVMWSAPAGAKRWLAGLMFVIISEGNLDRIRLFVIAAMERGDIVQ